MIGASTHDSWQRRVASDLDGHKRILASDPFKDWSRNSMPESTAAWQLECGLELSYGNAPAELATEYFRRAVEISVRALSENKLTDPSRSGGFPRNRGHALRARAYAAALLGDALDTESLLQASSDIEVSCKEYEREGSPSAMRWDAQAQAYYLASVRLALVAGDLERAKRLLGSRRSFKAHADEHALLKELVAEGGHPRGEVYARRFEQLFDKVRDPGYKAPVFTETQILRFELGAIRDKYLVSQDGTIDWRRTIDAIAA